MRECNKLLIAMTGDNQFIAMLFCRGLTSLLLICSFLPGVARTETPELRTSEVPTGELGSRIIAATIALPNPPQRGVEGESQESPAETIFCSFGSDGAQVLGLEIDNSFVAMPGMKLAARKESEAEWALLVVPQSSITAPELNRLHDMPLGRFRVENGSLIFAWEDDAAQRADYASQFRNAIVVLNLAGGKRAVCPRETVRWSAARVDMSKSVQRVDLPVSPPIATELLQLRVDSVKSPSPRFYPANAPKGDDDPLRATLTRGDAISSSLDIRIVPKGTKLVLELRSYYLDPGGARRPMVARQMITSASKRGNLLTSAQKTVSAADAAIPGLQSQLNSARSRSSDDPREQGMIIRNIQAADSALTKAVRARDRARQAIPEITSGLENMKQAIETAKKLHKNTEVNLSLVAVTPEYEVPVLRCGDIGK